MLWFQNKLIQQLHDYFMTLTFVLCAMYAKFFRTKYLLLRCTEPIIVYAQKILDNVVTESESSIVKRQCVQ